MDYSLPGSSVHGILQARILEWVAIPLGDLPDSGIKLASPASADGLFTTSTTWEALVTVKQHQKIWGLSTESPEQTRSSYKWNHFYISNIKKQRVRESFYGTKKKKKEKGFYVFSLKWPFRCPLSIMSHWHYPWIDLGKSAVVIGGKKFATCKPLGLGWKSSLETANGSMFNFKWEENKSEAESDSMSPRLKKEHLGPHAFNQYHSVAWADTCRMCCFVICPPIE